MPTLEALYTISLLVLSCLWLLAYWWRLRRQHNDAKAKLIQGRELHKCKIVGPDPWIRKVDPYTIVIDREISAATMHTASRDPITAERLVA